jgi:hypothetical protein
MHYDGCLDRYVVSPAGVSQVTVALLKAALGPLHVSYEYQGDVPQG